MKKVSIIYFLILLIGLFFSCKKIGKLKEFDLSYSQDITIPSGNTFFAVPFDIKTPETTTNTKADYKNEGTSSKLVERVTLTELILHIKSPQSGNFDFLNSIEVYLSSPNNAEVLVASKNNIPETGLTSLSLDVNSTDLKNYLQDDSFSLRVKTTTDRTITYDVIIQADETVRVKARLRNIFK